MWSFRLPDGMQPRRLVVNGSFFALRDTESTSIFCNPRLRELTWRHYETPQVPLNISLPALRILSLSHVEESVGLQLIRQCGPKLVQLEIRRRYAGHVSWISQDRTPIVYQRMSHGALAACVHLTRLTLENINMDAKSTCVMFRLPHLSNLTLCAVSPHSYTEALVRAHADTLIRTRIY
jgi:hypothetical protein